MASMPSGPCAFYKAGQLCSYPAASDPAAVLGLVAMLLCVRPFVSQARSEISLQWSSQGSPALKFSCHESGHECNEKTGLNKHE